MNWFLIFTNFVPISLLITLEMVKLIQGFFINWDLKLWDEHKDLRTVVNASNLNEELGQINAIFSDKTGTLTCNKMNFNKICIKGKTYGDDKDENLSDDCKLIGDNVNFRSKNLDEMKRNEENQLVF